MLFNNADIFDNYALMFKKNFGLSVFINGVNQKENISAQPISPHVFNYQKLNYNFIPQTSKSANFKLFVYNRPYKDYDLLREIKHSYFHDAIIADQGSLIPGYRFTILSLVDIKYSIDRILVLYKDDLRIYTILNQYLKIIELAEKIDFNNSSSLSQFDNAVLNAKYKFPKYFYTYQDVVRQKNILFKLNVD